MFRSNVSLPFLLIHDILGSLFSNLSLVDIFITDKDTCAIR